IKKSKKCTFSRFIMALGIKYVGSESADLLANFSEDIKKLQKLTTEELINIEGIGDIAADSIVEYFEDQNNLDEIEKLLSLGVSPQKPKETKKDHLFFSKIFVLTGSLENFTRDEAKKLIKERGGKTSSSVSKNTDYVLVGSEPGSKFEKAKKLGIKTLTEEEFSAML
ncbi:hypothetical protein LCGC14_1978980, partial [marine sediment metagenome]